MHYYQHFNVLTVKMYELFRWCHFGPSMQHQVFQWCPSGISAPRLFHGAPRPLHRYPLRSFGLLVLVATFVMHLSLSKDPLSPLPKVPLGPSNSALWLFQRSSSALSKMPLCHSEDVPSIAALGSFRDVLPAINPSNRAPSVLPNVPLGFSNGILSDLLAVPVRFSNVPHQPSRCCPFRLSNRGILHALLRQLML